MIEAGETVTIKSGRQAILADTIVDGDLIIEAGGDVFVPAGATFEDIDERIEGVADIIGKEDKTTPVNTDVIKIQESGGLFKKLTWANLKATLFDGAISLTSFGCIKFPTVMGGLIMQWGFAESSASGDVIVTYPIAFPNAIFTRVLSTSNGNITVTSADVGAGKTQFSFGVYFASTSARASTGTWWFAVGH